MCLSVEHSIADSAPQMAGICASNIDYDSANLCLSVGAICLSVGHSLPSVRRMSDLIRGCIRVVVSVRQTFDDVVSDAVCLSVEHLPVKHSLSNSKSAIEIVSSFLAGRNSKYILLSRSRNQVLDFGGKKDSLTDIVFTLLISTISTN